MDITVYTLEDKEGHPVNETAGEYWDYEEAKNAAIVEHARVIANEYEFSDSHMVDDFTDTEEEYDDADDMEESAPGWASVHPDHQLYISLWRTEESHD